MTFTALVQSARYPDAAFCLAYPDVLPNRNRDCLLREFASRAQHNTAISARGEGEGGQCCAV